MSLDKHYKVRVKLRNDSHSNWQNQEETFIPYDGEVVIYDILEQEEASKLKTEPIPFQLLKIGDGQRNLKNLPFLNDKNIIVSTKRDGAVPMYGTSAKGTINNQASCWVLTKKDTEVGWYRLPSAAFLASGEQNSGQGLFLPLTGGEITGSLLIKQHSLSIYNNKYPQIAFRNDSGQYRGLIYYGSENGEFNKLVLRNYINDNEKQGSVSCFLSQDGCWNAYSFSIIDIENSSKKRMELLYNKNTQAIDLRNYFETQEGEETYVTASLKTSGEFNSYRLSATRLTVRADSFPRILLSKTNDNPYGGILISTSTGSSVPYGSLTLRTYVSEENQQEYSQAYLTRTGEWHAKKVFGAVYNDYAEYRQANCTTAGRVVCETASGIMKLANERLLPACEIISDTFGFAIGETDNCKTPIACTGRVLAYTDKERNTFNIGDAVCSGTNGTVSVMTRGEICKYPDRIIGYVSEIPQYEIWGTGGVKVDGRIWIRIR